MNSLEQILVGVRYNKKGNIYLKNYPVVDADILVTLMSQVHRWLTHNHKTVDVFNPEYYDACIEIGGRYDVKVLDTLTNLDWTYMEYVPSNDLIKELGLENGTMITSENFAPEQFGKAIVFDVTDAENVEIYMSDALAVNFMSLLENNGYESAERGVEDNTDIDYLEEIRTKALAMDRHIVTAMTYADIYAKLEMEKYSVKVTDGVCELVRTTA